MTDLQTSIPSSESGTAETVTVIASTEEVLEVAIDGADTAASPLPYVVKKPHANSKLILQNMEEVLNSVKKQHRQKHRRKKEQKKLAQMEAAAAAAAGVEAVDNVGGSTVASHKHEKSTKRQHKKPLQEQAAQENGLHQTAKTKAKNKERKSPLKNAPAVSSNSSILKHFQRTPKKNDEAATVVAADDTNDAAQVLEAVEVVSPVKAVKATNAFEVMMNARNRSIGSNTPGKELPGNSTAVAEETATKTSKVKRKLLLQEWSEKKGGTKRKLEEEARAEYVDKQLDNRAKRFKKMLVGSDTPKLAANSTPLEKADEKHKENTTQKQPIARKRRAAPRRQRLISEDSVECLDHSTEVDPETAEFLSKLSSPTKKRDSLLGYFPKKESPKDLAAPVTKHSTPNEPAVKVKVRAETAKSRTRRSVAKRAGTGSRITTTTPVLVNTSAVEANNSTATTATVAAHEVSSSSTPRGRPKRSCASKARYDYDLQPNPTKLEKPPSKPTAKTDTPNRLEHSVNDTFVVINLEDSNCETESQTGSAQTTQKKLAPLFVRSMPKPNPDPVVLRARHEFLMSGVPEKMRLEQTKQQQCEQSYEEYLELFPKISHVQQFSEQELVRVPEQAEPLACKLRPAAELEEENAPTLGSLNRKSSKAKNRCSLGSISNCTAKNFQSGATLGNTRLTHLLQQHWPLPALDSKRAVVKKWKTDFERFPTYKCYNQMREKYRYFSAIDSAQDTEQVTESFVVTRRTRRSLEAQQKFDPAAEEEKPPATAPNGELLFTEKYKPLMFEQVLVNLTPVTQLREFLSNWSTNSSARNSETLEDSVDSTNDSYSNQQPSCNSVVLLGPKSSGKTSAVFALANDMNFNVLEINAGMKRTGKKLIQELQEATQSHQIRKESSAVHGKAQKNLLKLSLNGLKTKKPSSQNSDAGGGEVSSALDLSQGTRKCLILIEDADIVFEQSDAGFTDAIYTLAASSKRPVIVMATHPNCAHLQRLMHQNTINFTAPHTLNISRFLAVLSLMENCPVALDDLVSLYLYNNKDLRKTLLELQFFIQSGGDQRDMPKEEAVTKKPTQPQQQQEQQEKPAPYFASPSKRRFSEDPNAPQPDEQLNNNKEVATRKPDAKEQLYMHRTLFEFYTVGQNEKSRIPFPVDFRLLRTNLNDVLQAAATLKQPPAAAAVPASAAGNAKRKSRSPKKAWLNSATAKPRSPLDALCDFYENISVATLLSAREGEAFVQTEAHTELHFTDGLVPHVAEQIAHTIVEQAVAVNLAAEACPYNLFETPKETYSLSDGLTAVSLRTPSARCLDYEPALRAIYRSEKHRATLERRSTRFYHYLRNSSANVRAVATQQYDAVCDILQEPQPVAHETAATATTAAAAATDA